MKKRSYREVCGVARALDVVGERWTLLVVRELLAGPRRYTDLLAGLPGIGTNLLASRLKEMEAEGLLEKRLLPPPAASTVYQLTERGLGLRKVVTALGEWGMPLVLPLQKDDSVRAWWALLLLAGQFYRPDRKDVTVESPTSSTSTTRSSISTWSPTISRWARVQPSAPPRSRSRWTPRRFEPSSRAALA